MTAVTVRRRMRAGTRRISPGLRQPLAITGIVIAAAWIVIAVFAPLLAPSDPLAQTFTPSSARRGSTCSAPTSSGATSSAE